MNERFSNFLCGLLVGLFLAAVGFSFLYRMKSDETTTAATVVLKLGHGLDPTHPVHLGMLEMQKRLQTLSGGEMRLDVYPSGMLGSETQCLEQVQSGQLDMTKSSTSPMESFWPEVGVFTIPYVFRDHGHFWRVMDGEIGKRFLDMSPNLYGLCYYDAGARNFYTVRKAVRSPDDLKSQKIRVQQSRTAMDMVRCLGAAPTPISWGELYTALSQGTVDGAENNLPSFESGRHSEVCKHFTLNEHAFVPDMLLIGRARWKKLTPEQQNWLKQAADESSLFQRKLWKEEELRCRAEAENRGVTFHVVDKQPFAEATRSMRENVADETIADFVRKIRETP